MGKGGRKPGKREDRNKRVGKRMPKLGYYLIVTDTKETERNYFEGLRDSLSSEIKNHLVIKVKEAKTTYKLIETTETLVNNSSQYCIPWIVFDKDQVKDFDNLIKEAEAQGIHVGWSSPCFEIWFFAYFGQMPVFNSSQECWKKFKEHLNKNFNKEYQKNNDNIYKLLVTYGDSKIAIEAAEKRYINDFTNSGKKPSETNAVTAVFILVKEILEKIG